ncbi:hypothetical protein [Sulfitobacter mediterraneus]|uniref:hypothetical protein n=1 Tax=Sulfitobacter mediterraneus TaxID=83219 RepID=UPI00193A93C0|nr:hypothetical protein [Sulfitobacter mediterraneus]MBM1567729.1 hypothetical protein [Sulfitobacter mediterraneus]MBM1575375.1 hypothetical protein [Sulfitobacter mediterraneus]MBM1586745.1 hypothetical protein [Sulfitobacter mediterraneus]MBM1594392.1 hypothetical protein [Sulfitobacter mediterraneus]MBM1601955.1 hypothetical protein [Sulfitobacter mediterraneus]
MQDKNSLRLRKYSHISAMILAGGMNVSLSGMAQALTADEVLNKMSDDQRHGYISGIVDGYAYARWLSDRPDNTGSQCIYTWYYDGGAKKWRQIHQWFERHLDKPVDALLHVLIKKECGE